MTDHQFKRFMEKLDEIITLLKAQPRKDAPNSFKYLTGEDTIPNYEAEPPSYTYYQEVANANANTEYK